MSRDGGGRTAGMRGMRRGEDARGGAVTRRGSREGETRERKRRAAGQEGPRGGESEKEEAVVVPGPVLSRSHVRPYNTRNTCNTDNTCNTCVTHYTPARTTDRLSAGDDDRSRLPRPCATPRDFPKDLAGGRLGLNED